uniref:Uncharacterized protein n=1 Tax=Rhizophora mucronata TaxID=61149 RepID=A0A2P2QLE4_RHIMU
MFNLCMLIFKQTRKKYFPIKVIQVYTFSYHHKIFLT